MALTRNSTWSKSRIQKNTLTPNGTTLRINSHVLPSPFGEAYGYAYCGKWAREVNNYGRNFPHTRGAQLQFAAENHPLETCPPGSEELVFTITKTILGPKDWPYEEDYEEDYSYADLPSLQRRNPHLPLDDDEYNGPIVVAGSVQLPGEETPQEYIAKIYDSAYYPVSWDMECRKADDGIEPDCVIDAYNELWWWCQIDHRELQPHGVPIKKDGTAVVINFQEAIFRTYDRWCRGHGWRIRRERDCGCLRTITTTTGRKSVAEQEAGQLLELNDVGSSDEEGESCLDRDGR
ncbi:uncharacterized protein PODANS_2_6484 [Podospora anserina S mat+]|uniref:Podospora anserina S mat+ genomic DNA chromosome 2, supercontig 2 n=1 Tax=Podospora anserina (strain S / ATCC MYA-4624 / DSM 980 / FGSC 10383) TaxID=515849 RepID=B2B622_PODAN|nr:uncharacterized protein PODANS_2_6484 [Podospora anserina S mat+]CAP73247.1 unnamed protein product [Podospora anserina S mat+]CDP25648.1 Putative protein of unknown function [Podospora anserina S mat+]